MESVPGWDAVMMKNGTPGQMSRRLSSRIFLSMIILFSFYMAFEAQPAISQCPDCSCNSVPNQPVAYFPTLNQFYSWQFYLMYNTEAVQTAGGVQVVTSTWTETGPLPTGLTFTTAGVLSGTPTSKGTFTFTVAGSLPPGLEYPNGCTWTLSVTLSPGCPVITVAPATTPGATVGSDYSQQFTQTGGTGATTWTESGTLPDGIELTPGGLLGGTPTVPGNFPITLIVKDANGCTGSRTLTLAVGCHVLTITPMLLPDATMGKAYSQQFSAADATGVTSWSETGALPSGIKLTADGLLEGTPTESGPFSITLMATDSNGCTGNQVVKLSVCPVITISPGTLTIPNGTVRQPYSKQFTQIGGVEPITWSETGDLPNGITFTSDGLLAGTPLDSNDFPITVTATDANGCTGATSLSWTVDCETIVVSPQTVPSATVNSNYSQQFTKSDSVGPQVLWTLTGGTLPTGITLTAAGLLSGKPTVTGSFPIQVTITDSIGCSGAAWVTLVVGCQAITVTPTTLLSGSLNIAYSQQFTQVGAVGATTWSETGALPTGITLTASGLLAGTPTDSGDFPITVTVKDANRCTGSRQYTLVVVNPLTWQVMDAAVGADDLSRVLWTYPDGRAVLWSLNRLSGNYAQGPVFGPYGGGAWQASRIACGSDGISRVLWTDPNGTVSLWWLNEDNSFQKNMIYGPFAGWVATDIAVGSDNLTRILWTNANDGRAVVWSVDTTGNPTNNQNFYGPYAGYTAAALACGSDGLTRLIWANPLGIASLWIMNAQNLQQSFTIYGPYTGWIPTDIDVGSDNLARVLWTNALDGRAIVWSVDASGNRSNDQNFYGPFTGYTAQHIACGSDGYTRVTWFSEDGILSFWHLAPNNTMLTFNIYGPYD